MSRVLLINPIQNLEQILGNAKKLVQKYRPLGILYIAAVLREAGHDVSVIDAYGESLNEEGLHQKIKKISPDIVGVSVLTCSGKSSYYLGRWLKSNLPQTPVVFGNKHAEVFAEFYLRENCCDFVIHGEGEYVFTQIVSDLDRGLNFTAELNAVSYKSNGQIKIWQGPPAIVENLDALPLPARDLVDSKNYNLNELSNQTHIGGGKTIGETMITSRGCINKCAYCAVNQDGRIRFRSPEKVVEELEILEKKYHADYVFLQDPLPFVDRARILEICRIYRAKELTIRWGCEAHINFIDEELIKIIEKAGCTDLSFGIESGDQQLLTSVNKYINLCRVKPIFEMIKKVSNIRVSGLFILGLPGEAPQDSLNTIRFAKSLPIDMAQFSICTPYPGTKLFNELKRTEELRVSNSTELLKEWGEYSAYISFANKLPVWAPKTHSKELLVKLQRKAMRSFYFRPKTLLQVLKRIRFYNLKDAILMARNVFFG